MAIEDSVLAAKSEVGPPPALVRSIATVLRRIHPLIRPFRGQARIESLIHRRLAGRGWRDEVRLPHCLMRVPLDDLVGRSIYLGGVWEPHNTYIIRRLVRAQGVIFDVGANIGYYSLLLASLAEKAHLVHAFEPVFSNYKLLLENLSINPHLASMVQPHRLALSDCRSSLTMVVPASAPSQSYIGVARLQDGKNRRSTSCRLQQVPVATGDEFWQAIGQPRISLIKIDVEGHEMHTLKGMSKILTEMRDMIVLTEVRPDHLERAGSSPRELFRFLYLAGYRSFDLSLSHREWKENPYPRKAELVVFARTKPVPLCAHPRPFRNESRHMGCPRRKQIFSGDSKAS